MRRLSGPCTCLEYNISRSLLGERLLCLLNDIDVPRFGERDSFYGGWEMGHGWVEQGTQGRKRTTFHYIRL